MFFLRTAIFGDKIEELVNLLFFFVFPFFD
jgi:hypothetical protein